MKYKYVLLLLFVSMALMIFPTQIDHQVFALKNFFNCMTSIANKNHQLTVDDVNNCYAKEFKHPPT